MAWTAGHVGAAPTGGTRRPVGCGTDVVLLMRKWFAECTFFANFGRQSFRNMNEHSIHPPFSTEKLAVAFANTTASYKFYWFLSLLDLCVEEDADCFMANDVFVRMLAKAWAPVRYYHLSLGKMDSFARMMSEVAALKRLRDDSSEADVVKALKGDPEATRLLRLLDKNVPFRFLHPWLRSSDNAVVAALSVDFTNDCPYSLTRLERGWAVQLHPLWCRYFRRNYGILRDFAQWHLVRFVQNHNPLVPFVAEKMALRPRPQLAADRRLFWQNYLQTKAGVKCLFTGETVCGCSGLSHFLPWSFLPQEVNWNLMLADDTVEACKGNHLVDFGRHFDAFCREQHEALQVNVHLGMSGKPVMEQYAGLGHDAEHLCRMTYADFRQVMLHTFQPLTRVARNMGYGVWSA